MNIYDIKPSNYVKLKNPVVDMHNPNIFWNNCGGKIFRVKKVVYHNNMIYLDFRNVYKPIGAGYVKLEEIEKIIGNIYLQDDLFEL